MPRKPAERHRWRPSMPRSTSAARDRRFSLRIRATANYSPAAPDTIEVATFFGVIEAGRHIAPFSSAKPVVDSRSPALVAVGAVDPADGSGGIAFYSSQGPTNDGRIKPDVSAPSCVHSTIYATTCFNGTSAASPAAAGLAALLLGQGLALPGMPLAFSKSPGKVSRRGFDHFDHEGRPAACQIVGGADPAEQPVDNADASAGGGHSSRLGKQRCQRGLAEEGRLATHVRSGDQPQPIAGPKRAVIGDEPLAVLAKRLLDHRVAAALDFQARLVGQVRQAPSALRGAGGMGARNVDTGNRHRRWRQCAPRWLCLALPALRNARLRRRAHGLRPRPPAGLGMEVRRIEPDDAGQRLAVGEAAVRRHQPVGMLGGHLDMITEYGIMADLERRDARRFAIARLERGNRTAAVGWLAERSASSAAS